MFGLEGLTVAALVVIVGALSWALRRKKARRESLEEHEKHCDFCKGWKEQFKKSRKGEARS